ncbi:MAG: hypothetical protein WC342_01700 [Methanoregula sp.]|jgi:hypothetical protein
MENDNTPQDCNKTSNEDPNSIIKLIFDQFAITHAFKNVMDNTSLKVTNQLNDAIVLLIFLLILFYSSNILRLDLSLASVTLYVLAIFIIIEFIGANSPSFKRFFFSEAKAEYFLKTLVSSKSKEIDKNISLLTFSPKNINTFIHLIQTEKNSIHPYIIDDILKFNDLSLENLDKIFTSEFIKSYLRRELIIDLLIKYNNQLSPKNIDAIYSVFKDDDQLIKILIATQLDSQYLIREKNIASKIQSLYDKYQTNEKNKKQISCFIARMKTNIVPFRLVSLLILWPVLWIGLFYCSFYFRIITPVNESTIFLVSFFISGIVSMGIIRFVVDTIVHYWRDNAKATFLAML